MSASHGWNQVGRERQREIIEAIAAGEATRGPVHVELDLTDRCNVACYFCNQQDVRTKQQIPYDRIVELLDELVAGGLRSVRLSGGGDPLFHREILQVLEALTARGVIVDNLTTNGVNLTPPVVERLLANGCREVIVSLNAVDAADYHRMMAVKPGTFDKVLENVRHLVATRTTSLPEVVVQFLFDRENFQRIAEMARLGDSLGADRITIGPILEIPLERINRDRLLHEKEGERLRPYLEEILGHDREAQKVQLFFPYQAWNGMVTQIRAQIRAQDRLPVFPTAPSFTEHNGQCFFGWYTAAIRGNGDLYPCCMLINPTYEPLGNTIQGKFADQWNGPTFTRLRQEMREVMLRGGRMFWRPKRFQTLKPQCVKSHLCGLKNMYFRGDETFYKELGEALAKTRKKEVRWFGTPKQTARAAEIFAFRVYYGVRARVTMAREWWIRYKAKKNPPAPEVSPASLHS